MKIFPVRMILAVMLLGRMKWNSRNMKMWKNLPLARRITVLLDGMPDRGKSYTPYDKIYLLHILLENISVSDVPRFAISVLERQSALFASVGENDMKGYEYPPRKGEIEAKLIKWKEYTDYDSIGDDEWISRYGVHLRFDPIERTPLWEDIYYDVERETDKAMGRRVPRGMGFCFMYWSTKRNVLAKRGIEWCSPHEMNPRVRFD